MSSQLRRLLPAFGEQTTSPIDRQSPVPDSSKRIGTSIACTECRTRKIRCDGQRPRCSTCERREVKSCIYRDKPVKDRSIEVLNLLRTLPASQAHQLLNDLRAAEGQDGDLSMGLNRVSSNLSTDLTGPAQEEPVSLLAFEDELASSYPIAYPKFQPISNTALRASGLLRPRKENIWRSAATADKEEIDQPTQTGGSSREHGEDHGLKSGSIVGDLCSSASGEQQSTPMANFCHRRLQDLNISRWTNVPIGNDLAARIIKLYLETDHPLLGIFDPYLFINDLVDGATNYCSSFLVNTLMFFGCQMYTALDKVASQYVKYFYSESEKLYTTEKANDLPINVAALVLRSLSLMCQAKDDAVVQSANDSIKMGARLGFFKKGQPSSIAPEELLDNDTRMNAYLAWGAFCWHVTITLFYRQPHVEVSNLSPILPIPKNQFFNTVHHRAQEPDDIMGEVFPALCEFWLIVHSALWIYYCSYSDSPPDIWRSILSEHKFRELLAWSNRIPPSLYREKMSGPHVPVCHIWLHAALLDIVRTFTGTESQAPRIWTTFNASDSSADAAYKASVNQLKRLILDYRTNYETSTYSILWHTGLLYLINALIESPRDPEWHLYFLLCIYGYHSLRASYHVSESIGKGLLAMTLRETDLPVDEARKILKHLENGEPADPGCRPSATFMADLKLAELDPRRAQVENMAEEFEFMALFNEIMERNQMECSQ